MNMIRSASAILVLGLTACVNAQQPDCNKECLENIARQYMNEVVTQDHSGLPWGDAVRFTENNVAMMIGDGYWGAGPAVHQTGLVLADESTGNVLWFGITSEHEQQAYYGMRLKVEGREITEVETYHGREGTPDLFAATADYALGESYTQTLDASERRPRERLTAIVDGYYNSRQLNDGAIYTDFSPDCQRIINGVNTTSGDYWAARINGGCEAQLANGLYRPVDRIRARRYPIVDEATGVVLALSIEDHAVRYVDYRSVDGEDLTVEVEYPNSRGMFELFRIRDGQIERIESVSVFLPYYIHNLWR